MSRRYFDAVLSARFVAAPRGLGQTCMREWESVVMGAAPVVERFLPHSNLYRRPSGTRARAFETPAQMIADGLRLFEFAPRTCLRDTSSPQMIADGLRLFEFAPRTRLRDTSSPQMIADGLRLFVFAPRTSL